MSVSKIKSRGQITVPKEVRQKAGIEPGDVLTFEVTGPGEIRLRSLPRLRLAEALERYRIETPVDDLADRAEWQRRAAKDILSD